MGAFIEQVQKNNQLQQAYLSERARKETEKEKEKRKRERQKEYKENVVATKSSCNIKLYESLEEAFELYDKNTAFNVNAANKKEIIGEIIENDFSDLKNQDKDKLYLDLIKKYDSINYSLLNQAKRLEKVQNEIKPIEEEETVKTSSKLLKMALLIFGAIIFIFFQCFCGFISGLAGMNGGKRRRF